MGEEQQLSDAQVARRLWDIHQVENLMAKHVWYHAAAKNSEELADLWVQQTPDPHFAQNQGYYIGMESLQAYYGDLNITMQHQQLRALHAAHPDVDVVDENLGAGLFQIHPLTTQVIEVAGDGQTAKGIWYAPGVVGGPDPSTGEVELLWMWERYGADFAKEDGQWKIWHLHTYTDFGIPIGSGWQDASTSSMVGTGIGGESASDEDALVIPPPDRPVVEYTEFSHGVVPRILPRIPEPYWTFSETFSY